METQNTTVTGTTNWRNFATVPLDLRERVESVSLRLQKCVKKTFEPLLNYETK